MDPAKISQHLKDLSQQIFDLGKENDEASNLVESYKSKSRESEEEINSLKRQLKEAESNLQASERMQERMEIQFERTQETLRLQVRKK